MARTAPRRRAHDRQGRRARLGGYSVAVKLPAGLTKGNYYLSACTPKGTAAPAQLGCATAQRRRPDQGRHPGPRHAGRRQRCWPRPRRLRPAAPAAARWPSRAPGCTRRRATPATPASTPTSTSSTTRRRTSSCRARTSTCSSSATQCLTEFSLDFERSNAVTSTDGAGPEPDRAVDHDQRPAGDLHVQAADLPGRSERPGRSRPAGARRVELEPGLGDQPEPARLRADRHAARRCRACSAPRTSS